MAASMKRWHWIGESITRVFDHHSGKAVPDRLHGRGPSGMNQQPRVGWADNSAAIVGSPRYVQEKLSGYQARGWGQQVTGPSATQPGPALSFGGSANQELRNTRAQTPNLNSLRSTWVDKSLR
jgi:hypothetical protein